MMKPSPRPPTIAVTGLGMVSPLGNSLADSLARARRGERGIRRYEGRWSERDDALTTRVGGTVEGFDVAAHVDPRVAERYEPSLAWCLAAAREALADAGLDGDLGDPSRAGCAVGCGLPGAELWHRALHVAFAEGRPRAVPRMAALGITASAAPGQLALHLGLQGPCFGVGNACASGAAAIGLAADQIRLGRADRMLACGAESSMRSLMAYACFVDGGMHVTDEPRGACAPFALGRRGFVLAEGAAVLVLERLDDALARGARVYAVLLGEAHGNDAHHMISPDVSGACWARVIRGALAAAGVAPSELDVVSAHATGTPQGDVAETRALELALGAHAARVAVSATKSMHGHAFGAAGAIETALALAAMDAGVVLPTIDLDVPDPACGLDYVPHAARPSDARVLLKNAFGAGGVATCLVFRRGAA